MTIDDEQALALYRRNWFSSLGRSAATVDHYPREIAVATVIGSDRPAGVPGV